MGVRKKTIFLGGEAGMATPLSGARGHDIHRKEKGEREEDILPLLRHRLGSA